VEQVDLRDMFREAFCLYINHCGISWPLICYSIHFSCEDSTKHRRRPWWPWASSWRRYPNGILFSL